MSRLHISVVTNRNSTKCLKGEEEPVYPYYLPTALHCLDCQGPTRRKLALVLAWNSSRNHTFWGSPGIFLAILVTVLLCDYFLCSIHHMNSCLLKRHVECINNSKSIDDSNINIIQCQRLYHKDLFFFFNLFFKNNLLFCCVYVFRWKTIVSVYCHTYFYLNFFSKPFLALLNGDTAIYSAYKRDVKSFKAIDAISL